MKKLNLVLALLLFAFSINAQQPCNYLSSGPTPDSATLVSQRKSIEVHKLRADQPAPVIDGTLEAIWDTMGFNELTEVSLDNGEAGYKAVYSWFYNAAWLYLSVVVSGDDAIDNVGAANAVDRVELMLQNTFGGKGTTADHCDEADWQKWFWEHDGDKYWYMPIKSSGAVGRYFDQDKNDNCAMRPTTCGYTDLEAWNLLESGNQVMYESYSNADTIVYEMAFNWVNFLGYSQTPALDFEFGFEIQVKDDDGIAVVGSVHLNDPGDNAKYYVPALAKIIMGDTITPPVILADISNYDKTSDIKVYPNPGNGIYTFSAGQIIHSIQVFNLAGKLMKEEKDIFSTQLSLDLSTQSKGVYFVKVFTESATTTKKLILE